MVEPPPYVIRTSRGMLKGIRTGTWPPIRLDRSPGRSVCAIRNAFEALSSLLQLRQLGCDHMLGLHAHELHREPGVLEQQQGGDRADIESLRRRRVLIHVQLSDQIATGRF